QHGGVLAVDDGQTADGHVGHLVVQDDHVDVHQLRELQKQLVAAVQQVVGLLPGRDDAENLVVHVGQPLGQAVDALHLQLRQPVQVPAQVRQLLVHVLERGRQRQRSEEHTSELQSRENLVCRLLLEKKKLTQD